MKLQNNVTLAVILGAVLMLAGCQPQGQQDQQGKDKKEGQTQAKIAMLTGEGFQHAEAFIPLGYFTNRGADVEVIGPEKEKVKAAYGKDFTIQIEKAVDKAKVKDYEALIIPGGKAPSKLRENKKVVSFAKAFFQSDKPVASICHGPLILASAGVLEGKTSTGYKDIKEEVEKAGATFVDDSVVVDGYYVSSRLPKDLPYFCKAFEDILREKGLLNKK